MNLSLPSIFKRRITKAPSIYSGCSELPMSIFIDCLASMDLRLLLKPRSKNARPEELSKAWDNIFYEYIDLVRDPDQMYALGLMRDIALLESELNLTSYMVTYLSITYSKEIEDSLKRMGYRIAFKANDPTHNTKELERLIKQRKLRILMMTQKKKLLEDHQEKQKKGSKTDKSDYDKVLAELSAFQGYRLDMKMMSVSEYVAISNRYKKHVEASKKSQKWKK